MPIIERLDGRSDKIDFLLLPGTTLVPELLSFDLQSVLEINENENLIFHATKRQCYLISFHHVRYPSSLVKHIKLIGQYMLRPNNFSSIAGFRRGRQGPKVRVSAKCRKAQF